MSIHTVMRRALTWPAFAVAVLVLSTLPACAPEVPSAPTYTKDVQPILAAHCVRCHGANGMLNAMDGLSTPHPAPQICYLDRYDDAGDCTTIGSTTCQHGAAWCASPAGGDRIVAYTSGMLPGLLMPPAPSDSLNQWELDVLKRWSGANPAR